MRLALKAQTVIGKNFRDQLKTLTKKRMVYPVSCLLVLLGTCFHAIILYPLIIDDAFISFRYSANLATGQGLVFNSGELVEGYSNFLWTFIFAGVYRLGLSLPYTAWVLGLVLLLAILASLIQLGKVLDLPRPLILVILLTLASSKNLVGSSLLGLETPLFTFSLLAALYGLLQNNKAAWWVFGVSLSALSLTRPEGMFLSALLLGWYTLKYALKERSNFFKNRPFWLNLSLVGITWIIFLGCRLIFYGEIFPMSVIAKRDGIDQPLPEMLQGWRQGLGYIGAGVTWIGLFFIVFSLLAVAIICKGNFAFLKKSWLFYGTTATTVLFGLGIIVSNKGDWMPYSRLLAPYIPLIVIFMAKLVLDAVRARKRDTTNWSGLATAMIWTIIYGIIAFTSFKIPANTYPFDHNIGQYFKKTIFDQAALVTPIDKLGYALKEAYQPGDIFENAELGRVSFYSNPTKLIDMFGLTQPAIAKSKQESSIFGKVNPEYLGQLSPHLIVNNYWPDLIKILTIAQPDYVAITSQELTANRIFIVVRADAVARIAPSIKTYFEGKIVGVDKAITEWQSAYPKGQ